MALTRYQKGSLLPKTGLPKNRLWIGRWREDVVQPDGTITRPYKWEVLGTTRDYPTRKLALRALEARLSTINSPTYRARRQQGLPSLRTGGRATVLSQHKPSSPTPVHCSTSCDALRQGCGLLLRLSNKPHIFDTVLLPAFTTQMLAPSKVTPCGSAPPAGKIPITAPSLPRSLVTLFA